MEKERVRLFSVIHYLSSIILVPLWGIILPL